MGSFWSLVYSAVHEGVPELQWCKLCLMLRKWKSPWRMYSRGWQVWFLSCKVFLLVATCLVSCSVCLRVRCTVPPMQNCVCLMPAELSQSSAHPFWCQSVKIVEVLLELGLAEETQVIWAECSALRRLLAASAVWTGPCDRSGHWDVFCRCGISCPDVNRTELRSSMDR